MRRVLRLAQGVGAGWERVLLGIGRYLGLGRHDRRRVRGGRPRACLGSSSSSGLQAARHGGGAVLVVLGRRLVDIDFGGGSIVVGRVVHGALLLGLQGRRRGRRGGDVELFVGNATQGRRSSRRVEARRGLRMGLERCLGLRLRLRLGLRLGLGWGQAARCWRRGRRVVVGRVEAGDIARAGQKGVGS